MAIQKGMELTKSLRYKIRMMGIQIDGPTSVFYDNKLVVTRKSVPTSNLSKRHLGICYQTVREVVAVAIHKILHIYGEFNTTDVLTKILTAEVKRPHIRRILYSYVGFLGCGFRGIEKFPAFQCNFTGKWQ